MKTTCKIALIALFLTSQRDVRPQGFINLNFESANLTAIPSGQFGGPVSISDALPGWTGAFGANQATQVLQNNLTTGAASIDILGPDWNLGGIIQGQYTVVLQSGLSPSDQLVGTSISQMGLVPVGTQSILFEAQSGLGALLVSLGGQNISFSALSTGPNYTLYGGNIPSVFANQEEDLMFTASSDPTAENNWYVDDIQFSPQGVPEPGILSLFALGGGLFLAWRRCRKVVKSQKVGT